LKGKLLVILLALFLASSASAVTTYEMLNSDNNVFRAYSCVRGGGTEDGSGVFWLDIDVGGCVSELFVCWMEGFCGQPIIKDVWGVTSVAVSPHVIYLGDQVTAVYKIKNYSNAVISNQNYVVYVKDLTTGGIVPNSQSTEVITLAIGQEATNSKVYTIDSPDYRKKGNYSVVVKLATLQNDDTANNTASDDFTVVEEAREVSVPDTNLFLVPLIGLMILLIISLKTRKEE
jgi:hypothetical protein